MSTTVTPGGGGGAWPTAASRAAGFTDTFISRYVDTGELRLHAVTGGDGPPLLLVHGWPQTWYQWRMVMPALARDFQVVAVDHQRFALVGHDTGIIVRGREDIFFGAEYAASAWKDDNPVLARIGPATGKALAQFAAADGGRPARERRPRRLLDLWPAIYFADARGLIRHHHFGEGEYQQSEMVIQQLLAEAGSAGAGHEQVSVDARGAEAPADWATDWTMEDQATTLNTANGRIAYRFHARDLHLVMRPAVQGTSARFRVLIDGQPPGAAHGVDVDDQGSG